MKKMAFILIAGGLTLVSCKKDWTCECTTNYSDGTASETHTRTITDHLSDAQADCNSGDNSAGGVTTECSLKS